MEPHPLRGAARWILLPALGAAGGIAGGIAMAALMNLDYLTKPMPWRLGGWGIFLGLGPGLAAAMSARPWRAGVLAPSLALPGVIVVDFLLFDTSFVFGGPATYLGMLVDPGYWHVGTLVATVPAATFHAWRLRAPRTPAWAPAVAHLIVSVVAAAFWTWYESFGLFLPALGFCGLLALGHVAGIELALRSSRP